MISLPCFLYRYTIPGEGFFLLGDTLNVDPFLMHCITNHFSSIVLCDSSETHATTLMFFDHLSKLLYAKNILSLASYERSMLFLEEKWFRTIDEIMEKANELRRQTQEVNIDLRNFVFYVDYDEKQGTWKKRVQKIKIEKMQCLISDIQRSIRLVAD